ncbi:MAG: DUF3142 domain-containing protein [Verrucomicrobia bacterium]|nr:DUF3142 domain-containing protein [Verrucomicrobiota bacterium]
MRRIAIITLPLATLALVFLLWPRTGPRAHGALSTEAYVWQRVWNQPVRAAVAAHATNFAALIVLHAEVSWKDGQPRVVRVPLPWDGLKNSGARVGLALRIGPFNGPFAAGDARAKFLADLAASLLAEARSNACPVAELQLDFDCAESKLAGYRFWVESIRTAVAPVPLTLTTLPSWLKHAAFTRLVRAADGFVLQVHSLTPPRGLDSPFTLCDPATAQRAVERAGRVGVPFRVALPTYGYLVAFDRTGKFIGLSAEGPRRVWPEDTQLREAVADPASIASLVRAWTDDRPATLRGIIWYRLPVEGDARNWRWPTLAAVMTGRGPRADLRAEASRKNAPLAEIVLRNDGDADYTGRVRVLVRAEHSRVIAGDAVNGFELSSPSSTEHQFDRAAFRLPPGERRVIGWLRLERDTEVQLELKSD